MTDTAQNSAAAAATPNNCGNANVINVGVPGNIRPVILAPGQSYTVADVIRRAGFNSCGYELRIAGDRANLETAVQAGQTVLLLKAVRGAVDDNCGNANVINVGVPGNIRPVILAPGQTHTVSEVLQRAGFNSAGYELRISGDRANLETVVQPGQTILLLKAVRGA